MLVALFKWMMIITGILITAIKLININKEWQKAVILRLGEYVRTEGSGFFLTIPFIEKKIVRDMRTQSMEMGKQEVITKDNISVNVDAVAFIKVINAEKSVTKVDDMYRSVRKYTQVVLRNVIGKKDLDALLAKREEIAEEIRKDVDEISERWGVDVEKIELQDVVIPENMKRVMARQAEAEREKRGSIISAKGEKIAAKHLKEASEILEETKYGYGLRQLEELSDISQDRSNTIVFFPTRGLNTKDLLASVQTKVPKTEAREVEME